jgi:5'(3')-deoxyribonucleotidase
VPEPRSFVLGVDLDGVCGDYTTAFANVVAAERDVDTSTLPSQRGWDFAEWELEDLGGFDAVHRLAVMEHRMFRTMPVMPGAADALWRLSDAGVWIRIITHRLWVNWGHAIAVSDTVEWLDHQAIPYRDICFLGRKPEVEADCYVDDSPDMVEALRGAGNTVVVFDAPYNRDLEGPRAETWADVEQAVSAIVFERGIPLQAALPGLDDGPHRLRGRLGG